MKKEFSNINADQNTAYNASQAEFTAWYNPAELSLLEKSESTEFIPDDPEAEPVEGAPIPGQYKCTIKVEYTEIPIEP
jgi:hypothetical protein